MSNNIIKPTALEQFLFSSNRSSLLWLAVRLYVGWTWFQSGLGKLTNSSWVGENAGQALSGFVKGAVAKASGERPSVSAWYARFLSETVLPNSELFSYLVVFGELLVGIALIVGIVVGLAAFFGFFMNLNFLLAGTISLNPILLILSLLLVIAWRVAGYLGLDQVVLPLIKQRFCRRSRS